MSGGETDPPPSYPYEIIMQVHLLIIYLCTLSILKDHVMDLHHATVTEFQECVQTEAHLLFIN